MNLLAKIGDWRFYAALRSLKRRASSDAPVRPRAILKAGYQLLEGEEQRRFLARALVRAVEEAPQTGRLELFRNLTEPVADKLDVRDRTALPGQLLVQLGGRLRPRHYADVLIDSVRQGLTPFDRKMRQMADNRLVNLAAIDQALEQEDLSEVLAPGDHPIVVGPWTMEVGFELLYWIPLLRRYLGSAGVDPARVTVISRGGVAGWYGGLAGHYVELLEDLSPVEFKALGEAIEAEHESKKPFTPTAPERELVERVSNRRGLSGYRTIYPAALYGLFRTMWLQRFGGEAFMPALQFAPIQGAWPRPKGLPFEGSYVAVKFYSSEFFEGEKVAPFVARLLTTLAERHNVVVLNTGLNIDEHSDIAPLPRERDGKRIFFATPLLRFADNLAIQTALVANADKLYCTFGGFSYLGPLLGVNTFSFFTHTHFVSSHLDLALRAFNRDDYGSLAFLPVAGMDETAIATLAGGDAIAGMVGA